MRINFFRRCWLRFDPLCFPGVIACPHLNRPPISQFMPALESSPAVTKVRGAFIIYQNFTSARLDLKGQMRRQKRPAALSVGGAGAVAAKSPKSKPPVRSPKFTGTTSPDMHHTEPKKAKKEGTDLPIKERMVPILDAFRLQYPNFDFKNLSKTNEQHFPTTVSRLDEGVIKFGGQATVVKKKDLVKLLISLVKIHAGVTASTGYMNTIIDEVRAGHL